MPLSSYPRAQYSRWASIARLCVVWLVFAGGTVAADDVIGSQTYRFDIPSQSADSALTEFAEQADLTLVFPDELVRDRTANALIGEYSLEEGAAILLDGTGLIPSFSNPIVLNITIDDTSTSGEKAVNATKKAGLLAIIAGALSGGVEAQEPTVTETEIQTSVVTGTVTDARTGANLRGAKITIEETGQWTSTGDLGRFRFASVPAGEYTLTVSFLGYAGQSVTIEVHGSSVAQSFALRGGTEIEEIVVFGQRSARAQALNQERTAPNSTNVLSSDLIGNFNGTTISEALRRAPGIAFVPDDVTGDGAQIIVRGLEPDLNQVTLNGVRLLDGTGLGRSPDLSNILTESIDSIVINKTLLPSQDSNGAGALIEIETKGPLDRPERFASFSTEYGQRSDDFEEEFGIEGTLSGIFGESSDFGMSLSLSYRDRSVTRVSYSADGIAPEVLPSVNRFGDPVNSTADIDPRTQFPFDGAVGSIYPTSVIASQGSIDQETLSLIGALQKDFSGHTDLRFDVVYTQQETTSYSAVTQPSGVARVYDNAPVNALGGMIRPVLVGEDVARNNDDFLFGEITFRDFYGDGILGSVFRSGSLQPDQEQSTLVISGEGTSAFDQYQFDYGLGYSRSEDMAPVSHNYRVGTQVGGATGIFGLSSLGPRSFLSGEALANATSDGRIISIFPAYQSVSDGQFIVPLLSAEGFDFYNTIDNLPLSYSTEGAQESQGEEWNANFHARRDFNTGIVKYASVGLDYSSTEFTSPGDIGGFELGTSSFRGATDIGTSNLGFIFGDGILASVGALGDFDAVTRGSFASFVGNVDQLLEQGLLVSSFVAEPNPEKRRETSEERIAGFVEAQANFGRLELIGGVRVDRIEVGATFFNSPDVFDVDGTRIVDSDDFGELLTDSATQTDVLPRILANYRFSEELIARVGYYTTVSRPQIQNLTQQQLLSLNLNPLSSSTGDRPTLGVFRGNPDLEPATTHNFNFDVEWYTDDIGAIKVAAFYKKIENPLASNFEQGGLELLADDIVLPDIEAFNNLSAVEVIVRQPVNGDDDNEVWGLEIAAERQLGFLPGVFSGLGLYANYAYVDSSSTQRLSVPFSVDPSGFVEVSDVPFEGSPRHQGTIGPTFTGHRFEASLFYTAQSRRFASTGSYGFDNYDESVSTLDFQAIYNLALKGTDLRFVVRGEDLLSDTDDPFLQTSIGGDYGVPEYSTGGTYFGGRSIFVGVGVTF